MTQDLGSAAVSVLKTGNAADKAARARAVASAWRAGTLDFRFATEPELRPARPGTPELLAPAQMPKRRKGGTLANRTALVHAVAHIELNAIDLAFDMVARFGDKMPKKFSNDWVGVGDDEARHFMMLSDRLKALDSFYGAMPAHDGLWQSAQDTANDLPARLAVVPMVLEARGLDVTPDMITRLTSAGDQATADCLTVIYEEEVAHVAAGKHWFSYLAEQAGQDDEQWFHTLVRRYFKGSLKPPFNKPARNKAGMPVAFYEPLADLL